VSACSSPRRLDGQPEPAARRGCWPQQNPVCISAMPSGRQEVVNEYKIPSNYPEHAAIVQIHGPPGLKRGAQVKPAVRPNSLVAPVADDIRHAFVQYDSDHSGYIELRELERATAALTLAHSPRPLTQALTQPAQRYDAALRMLTRTRAIPCLMPCVRMHTPSTRPRPPRTRHALRGLGIQSPCYELSPKP